MKLIEVGKIILSAVRAIEDIAIAAKAVDETYVYFRKRWNGEEERPPPEEDCDCEECVGARNEAQQVARGKGER